MIDTILLDRDGTLIVDGHYLSNPDEVELLPGVIEGLSALARAGARFFQVSNQSGIGRGYFDEEACERCQARLQELLAARDLRLTDALCCPHAPEADCSCRKPLTGMWETLRGRYGLDAARSAMVGDKEADVLFGRNAGLALSVLVLTGKGEKEAARMGLPPLPPDTPFLFLENPPPACSRVWPHAVARDMESAAAAILTGSRLVRCPA